MFKPNLGKSDQTEDHSETPQETPSSASVTPNTFRDRAAGPAIIGPTIHIQGDVKGDEDLIIEGSVEGTIKLEDNNLTIGDKGRVSANIDANTVNVLGELRGDINGKEKVIIRNTGNVLGNIVSPRVSLEDGAMFKGSIEMEPNQQAAKRNTGQPTVIATKTETAEKDDQKGSAVSKTGS